MTMTAPRAQSQAFSLTCIRCGTDYPATVSIDSRGCLKCAPEAPANLAISFFQSSSIDMDKARREKGLGMIRFSSLLPVPAEAMVRLGEGDTPLVAIPKLGKHIGIDRLYFKDESRNPTWSHKDRFSAVAVAHARHIGAPALATASSGNAGASLAAYAAKADIPCIVFTFQNAAGPMVEQIRRYGAMVVPVPNPEDRWPLLAEGVARFNWMGTSPFHGPVVGSHPVGIEGYKTIAYELYEDLGADLPDWIIVPTSYGDVLAGIWRGFQDLVALGLIQKLPRMVVAEVYSSLEKTIEAGSDQVHATPRTYESIAVSIGASQGTFQSLKTIRQSGGTAVNVRDQDLLDLQNQAAKLEGVLGELSSIASVAAARQLRENGTIAASDSVVCIMTSTGLKDLDKSQQTAAPLDPVCGGIDAALDFLSSHYGFKPTA